MFCPKCGTSIGIDFRDCLEPHTYGISVSSTVSIITFPLGPTEWVVVVVVMVSDRALRIHGEYPVVTAWVCLR